MSKPGPKPKPSNVHYLRGNPSKLASSDLAAAGDFRPEVELPKVPRFLQLKGVAVQEAKAEYTRLGRELERYGLVSQLDRGALAVLAVEWGMIVWAQQRMTLLNAEDPKGSRGFIDHTPQGYPMQSVELQIFRKAQENYLKGCALFGLSPSDRTRIRPNDQQLPLSGFDDPDGTRPPSLRDFA